MENIFMDISLILSRLSPTWSQEPGRTNTVRTPYKKGYLSLSWYTLPSNKTNFVLEVLADNNTLKDQYYFHSFDECLEQAQKMLSSDFC